MAFIALLFSLLPEALHEDQSCAWATLSIERRKRVFALPYQRVRDYFNVIARGVRPALQGGAKTWSIPRLDTLGAVALCGRLCGEGAVSERREGI
jgi:hypothetical protein